MSSEHMTKQEKKALKHDDKAARKQEKKMRKQMKKDKRHGLHGSHAGPLDTAAAPAVGTGLGAGAPLVGRDVAAPVVHTAAVPVAPVVPMQDKVVHEPERVIRHEPLVEKEIINERPVEVKHEHHIQPIVHETEHRIQPIIKTEAITETSYIVQDKNVMLPPIVEPPHMVGGGAYAVPSIAPATNTASAYPVASTAARSAAMPLGTHDGRLHEHGDKHLHKHGDEKHLDKRDKHLRKQENLMRKQHQQDMMMMGGYPGYGLYHPHHHHVMMMGGHPAYFNHPMMMQRGMGGGYGYGHGFESDRLMDAEQRLNWGMVAPLAPGEKVIPIEGAATGGALGGLMEKLHLGGHSHAHDGNRSQLVEPAAPGMSGVETGSMQNRAGFGQKIKGAMKEVQGAITRNPAKKEEGKMIMQGVDSATAATATGAATHAPTTATTAI